MGPDISEYNFKLSNFDAFNLGIGWPFISYARITSPNGSMALSNGKEQQYWFPTSSWSYPSNPHQRALDGGGIFPRLMLSTSIPASRKTSRNLGPDHVEFPIAPATQ